MDKYNDINYIGKCASCTNYNHDPYGRRWGWCEIHGDRRPYWGRACMSYQVDFYIIDEEGRLRDG